MIPINGIQGFFRVLQKVLYREKVVRFLIKFQLLILTGVVLERSLEENSCSESFYKIGEVINERFTS